MIKKNNASIDPLHAGKLRIAKSKYQAVADYINTIAKKHKIVVYFNDVIVGWWNAQLLFHYNQLIPLLDESVQIFNPAQEQGNGINVATDSLLEVLDRHVVIVDFLTENESLEWICKRIISEAREKRPLILYISMLKGLAKDEMQTLIEHKEEEIEEKRKKGIEDEFKKEIAENKERFQHFSDFVDHYRNLIPTGKEKEYALKHLDLLDKYVTEEIQNDVDKLRYILKGSNWNSSYSSSFYTCSLYNYYPTTFMGAVDQHDWSIRHLIWDFKNSEGKTSKNEHDQALDVLIPRIKNFLKITFDDNLPKLTFVCIPASTRVNTERRFKQFSSLLCNETGMNNGYDYVEVVQDGAAKHLGGETTATINLNESFFKNKIVLLFDDVITRGRSMIGFKNRLENSGAFVVGGLSIGQTRHENVSFHPIFDLLGIPANKRKPFYRNLIIQEVRHLTKEELQTTRSAKVVNTTEGIKGRFIMENGGETFIPISTTSNLFPGEIIDLQKVQMIKIQFVEDMQKRTIVPMIGMHNYNAAPPDYWMIHLRKEKQEEFGSDLPF